MWTLPFQLDIYFVGSTATINILIISVRGSILDFKKYDFYRRQILTSIDVSFWRLKLVPALKGLSGMYKPRVMWYNIIYFLYGHQRAA